MHRWAPRHALGVLLLLSYPFLTHAAVTTGLAYLAWTAWLCIAALVVLSFPGQWGLAGFALLAAAPPRLALLATHQPWSLFANGIDYLLVGVLFVGEYVFRRMRYRQHSHRSLADVVRTVARSGRLAPRRTARK